MRQIIDVGVPHNCHFSTYASNAEDVSLSYQMERSESYEMITPNNKKIDH